MASGTLLCRFGAAAAQPPPTAFATLDVRASLLVLDYDDAATEVMYFVDVLPPTYSGGGLTVKLRWMATTAVSGNVFWIVQFERAQRGVDDIDVNGFGPQTGVLSAAVAPSGTQMQAVIALTAGAQIDNIAVGDGFRFVVARWNDGTDTMVGDAELVGVEVYET